MAVEIEVRETENVPAALEILKEVEKLRQRSGVTYARMAEAPLTQQLPVVGIQLEGPPRRAEEDRPFVTYDVLACAARREDLLGRDFSAVVTTTMNFDHAHNELGVRRRQVIHDLNLRSRQHISAMNDGMTAITDASKIYKNLEKDAFTQFAGLITGLRFNPCLAVQNDGREIAAKVAGQVALLESRISTVETFLTELQKAFGGLRIVRSELQLLDACDRILSAIPRGRLFAEAAWGVGDELEILVRLARGAIEVYHAAWLEAVVIGPDGLWYGALDKTEFTLYWDIVGRGDVILERSIALELAENLLSAANYDPKDDVPELWREMNITGRQESAIFEIEASFEILTRIFVALETANDWESIDPGALSVQPTIPSALLPV